MSKKTAAFNLRNIPPELRQQFKVRCAENGLTMTEAILTFMRSVVAGKEKPTTTSGR